MNLPNKLTMLRILMAFVIIVLLLFPFDAAGFEFPLIFVNEAMVINVKYLILILTMFYLIHNVYQMITTLVMKIVNIFLQMI